MGAVYIQSCVHTTFYSFCSDFMLHRNNSVHRYPLVELGHSEWRKNTSGPWLKALERLMNPFNISLQDGSLVMAGVSILVRHRS